jgi:hypothetical protein
VKRTPLFLLGILGLVLVTATGVQFCNGQTAVAFITPPPLRLTLPLELSGWISSDLPIAETEEMKTAVEDILQFDDHFSRAYRTGNTEITLYIAYWGPDRMPPRMVGRHTPDRCWIANGWNCESRERAVSLAGTRWPLKPAETGTYAFKQQARLHVAFWHLVGGEVYAYGPTQTDMIAVAPLKDLLTFGLNQRKEQYFIRLASTVPLDQIWHEPGFRQLLAALEQLGIRAAP